MQKKLKTLDRALSKAGLGSRTEARRWIGAGRASFFYAPDVVSIADGRAALAAIDLYAGDGAAITRSIVRYREGRAIGHASIRVQQDWCARARVARAIFTHCGSEIVTGEAGSVAARVAALGRERGVDASVARDGLELTLPCDRFERFQCCPARKDAQRAECARSRVIQQLVAPPDRVAERLLPLRL